jgi:DNA mismatch repair protein MutS
VPQPVIRAARRHLASLEENAANTRGQLDLFRAAQSAEPACAPMEDRLRQHLELLDCDALSPREALETLYALKRMAGEDL